MKEWFSWCACKINITKHGKSAAQRLFSRWEKKKRNLKKKSVSAHFWLKTWKWMIILLYVIITHHTFITLGLIIYVQWWISIPSVIQQPKEKSNLTEPCLLSSRICKLNCNALGRSVHFKYILSSWITFSAVRLFLISHFIRWAQLKKSQTQSYFMQAQLWTHPSFQESPIFLFFYHCLKKWVKHCTQKPHIKLSCR